jgi:hypothetical protein
MSTQPAVNADLGGETGLSEVRDFELDFPLATPQRKAVTMKSLRSVLLVSGLIIST